MALALPGKKTPENIFFSWVDFWGKNFGLSDEGRSALIAEKMEFVSKNFKPKGGKKPVSLLPIDAVHAPGIIECLKDPERRRKTLASAIRKGYFDSNPLILKRFNPTTGKVNCKMTLPWLGSHYEKRGLEERISRRAFLRFRH
jgi:hypothetical protein